MGIYYFWLTPTAYWCVRRLCRLDFLRCFWLVFKPLVPPISVLCNHQPFKELRTALFHKESIHNEYGYKSKTNKLLSVKAWYIPLCKSVLPPSPDSKLTAVYVRNLLKYVCAEFKDELIKNLTKQKKRKKRKVTSRQEFFLFSQPRPSGNSALFGVFAKGYSNCSFFKHDSDKTEWRLYPLSILRHYGSYLLERGGATANLKDITIAVIGCGAIGSRIIEQLVLSGVGNIIIIDDDILSEDNIYRHVLGGQEIGYNKAEAMKIHLEHRLPCINVTAKPMTREQWINTEAWNDVQMIIDATADFTGMREMNKKNMGNSGKVLPVIYCWLEACGIGGHTVLVDGKSKGCLECLFEFKDQGPYRRSDFLNPYQDITKDLTGCGGAFTPYSALDSIKTATLTVELALEFVINGRESSYRYWVGDNKLAEDSGLKQSPWYEKAKTGSKEEVDTKFSKRNCPICGAFK